MSEVVYRVKTKTTSLQHAYDPSKRANRYSRTSSLISKKESAEKASTARNSIGLRTNKYGNYKSPYYDPVERHERYMRERASLGIGKGLGSSGKGSSGKGSKGKSKGKSKSRGRGNSQNISAAIQKLREESQLNTEAQREATRRKIEDLKEELKQHAEKLSGMTEDGEEGLNVADIRGTIQQIKDQLEQAGGDLQKWITNEKDALERRIAALYASAGKKYKVTTQADKQNASKARQTEIKSRADSIYKKKS